MNLAALKQQKAEIQLTPEDSEYVINLFPQSSQENFKFPIEFAHLHVKTIHQQPTGTITEDQIDIFPRFTTVTFSYSAKGQVSQPLTVIYTRNINFASVINIFRTSR